MGYTTWFNGTLQFNKPITEELKNYINSFARTRHMKRNVDKIKRIDPQWESKCFDGNLGLDGEYYIGEYSYYNDKSVINYNIPPTNIPSLWCQWIINKNGELEWDGGEKFYEYVAWLNYLIENFFKPKGYVLNGVIDYYGEDDQDYGRIKVKDNKVSVLTILSQDAYDIPKDILLEEINKRDNLLMKR